MVVRCVGWMSLCTCGLWLGLIMRLMMMEVKFLPVDFLFDEKMGR